MGLEKEFKDLTGIENNETWLSKEEVSVIEQISKSTFYRRFQVYQYTYRYVSSLNGGRGGKKLEIALSSLSAEAQERYLRNLYGCGEATVKDLASHCNLVIPSDKLNDPAIAPKIRMLADCLAVPEGARYRSNRIRTIAESYGYHLSTAYRLIEKARKGIPIVGGSRNHGTTLNELGLTLRAWDEQSAQLSIEKILNNKRRLVDGVSLYKEIEAEAAEQDLVIGSYRSFMAIAQRIRSDIKTYRDKGIQGLRQDVLPPIRRDATAYRPMECLIGDQHKADYYAFDRDGRVATLELFCWMDFRTQLAWGAVSYKHYNRYTVGQALLNAVRWGLPSFLYVDWGKPEKSEYIKLLIQQLIGLGITVEEIHRVKATPRHPQAKPIEGWYAYLDRTLRNRRIPGYCKRLKDSRENELQQRELKELIKSGKLLTVHELVDRIIEPVKAWNDHVFKNRGQDTGKSPVRIYREETERYPVATLSDDLLDYIFLPLKKVKITRSRVRIRREWLGPCTYYARELSEHNGREAEVRYDPFDDTAVWVFMDRKLICRAEKWEAVNPKMRDEVDRKREEQRSLMNQIRTMYREYAPRGKTVRRINPHEREARQLKEAEEVRVLRTTLEAEMESDEHAAVDLNGWRQQHQARIAALMAAPCEDEEKEYRSPFRLSIDDPYEEEE